jgi:hypothetical protein
MACHFNTDKKAHVATNDRTHVQMAESIPLIAAGTENNYRGILSNILKGNVLKS